MPRDPLRGEIWMEDLDPGIGREQTGKRPVLVVSIDHFNRSPAELIVVLPVTSKPKGVLWHVEVLPPEGNLIVPSYVKCEDVRCVSKLRLSRYLGRVEPETIEKVEYRMRVLLALA